MTLTEYIREQARVADANSKEWMAAGDEANMAYRDGMWYAYNDVEARVAATECELEQERSKLTHVLTSLSEGTLPWWQKKHDDMALEFTKVLNQVDDQRLSAFTALEEARQLLVTANGEGEYGAGEDWDKRYKAWQEAVRVLGVK